MASGRNVYPIVCEPGDGAWCEGCDDGEEATPATVIFGVGPIFCRSRLALCADCLRRFSGVVAEQWDIASKAAAR